MDTRCKNLRQPVHPQPPPSQKNPHQTHQQPKLLTNKKNLKHTNRKDQFASSVQH